MLVMRSMCRRGALLLISGGNQAFHARLVTGPEGAFILGDSNWEPAHRGLGEGDMKRQTVSAPFPPLCTSSSPLCNDQTLLQAGYRITNECPVKTVRTGFSRSLSALLAPQAATRGNSSSSKQDLKPASPQFVFFETPLYVPTRRSTTYVFGCALPLGGRFG